MSKLTDKQKKQIVAEYIEGDGSVSQRTLAERYQVSQKTVSKILSSADYSQKVSEKKDENTRSMLEYLDSRKEQAQSLIDKILSCAEKDIEKACLRDKMGAVKILSEVFAGTKTETKDETPVQIIVEAEDASNDGAED